MTPATLALCLILISALAHALIGAIMKRADNKLVFRGILGAAEAAICLPLIFFLPALPPEIWAILALSVLVHNIYHITQALAFTHGDMSFVYPIMRGTAPALTAAFAFLILREPLGPIEILGLAIVVTALIGFGWTGGERPPAWWKALGFALTCGLLTALYTVIDAYGMRAAPHKFSFIVWFFVIEGFCIAVIMAGLNRVNLRDKIQRDLRPAIVAGGLAIITYGCALYAFSLAPLAHLAATRETSVIFGALLAVFWLGESFGWWRTLLAVLLALGLILMHMA